MNWIIDASIAIQYTLSKTVREKIKDEISTAGYVLAPMLIKYEIGNALIQYVKHKKITLDKAIQYYDLIFESLDILMTSEIDSAEIIKLALHENLSYYDASYLYLAISRNYGLLTLDKKLQKSAQALGITSP